MYLNYAATKALIRTECETLGLGCVFHDPGEIPSPYSDGTSLHLNKPQGMWSDVQWAMWKYEVYHEMGHEDAINNKPNWKEVLEEKKIATGSLLGSLFNLVEDHVQEHNRIGAFKGRDRTLKYGRSLFVNERLLAQEVLAKPAETREGGIFKVCAVYDTLCREDWNEYLRGGTMHAAKALEGDEAIKFDKLVKSGIRIQDGKNGYESYEIAKKLLDAMGEDAEEEERKAQEQLEKGESSGTQSGDGEGGDESTAGGLSEDAAKEIAGYSFHTHYEKPDKDMSGYNSSMQGQHIEYGEMSGSQSFTPKEFEEIIMKSEYYNGMPIRNTYTEQYDAAIASVTGGEMLASKVKRLFVSKKQALWEHGTKRGRISGKNLWKARGPIYSQEVFRKKVQRLDVDTAVTVLCDFSGSMSGNKYVHAAKAGIMLNEAVAKIGVPIELLGFSESREGPIHAVMKSFSEVRVSEPELRNRYAIASNWMGQNSDGESIVWAYTRLIKREESRKVLIVLSDGSPAAYNGSHGAEWNYTKKVVEHIQDKTPVEIYGVGIMDSNVKQFYKDYKIITKSEELEDLLLGLVKTKILK